MSRTYRTTLPFLQNFIVTTYREYLQPTKNPRSSKGLFWGFVLKIRAHLSTDDLDYLIRHFKLAGENRDINYKFFPEEYKKCLQGRQGRPDLQGVIR